MASDNSLYGNERYGAKRNQTYDMQRNVRANFDSTNPPDPTEPIRGKKDASTNSSTDWNSMSTPQQEPLWDYLLGMRDETIIDKRTPKPPAAFSDRKGFKKG